jgi:Family of unknown function (DUF5336)
MPQAERNNEYHKDQAHRSTKTGRATMASYPYGSQDPYPSDRYGGYWPPSTSVANQRASPGNQLVWAVLVLGLTTYVVSYAAAPEPGPTGWGVRFSMLAAVVAGLGLLPRQNAPTKWAVTFAVMGFLESLPRSITDDQNPRWASIVIAAVTALQAVTAITALLAQPRVPGTVDSEPGLYDAYAYYAQAARQYYATNAQQPEPQRAQAQATTQTGAAAPARAQQSAAERYALYEEYLGTQSAHPNPAAFPPQPGGRTQTTQPAAGSGVPTSGPPEGIQPRTDPQTGLTSQSWPL